MLIELFFVCQPIFLRGWGEPLFSLAVGLNSFEEKGETA
jgi:hypothetical protein